MTAHGRAQAYLDGELGAAEEAAFLDHLAGCAECQRALEGGVQLAALEDELRVGVVPMRRRRRAMFAATGAAIAAAAVLVIWMARRPAPPVALALGPTRSIEVRVTYPEADRFRPYDVARGGSDASRGDVTPPDAIAALAARGDHRAVAIAYLLAGDRGHAVAELQLEPAGPDRDCDRGAAAYLGGDLETALADLDRALAAAPDHHQALWNRGLVLRDLGLPLAAAAMFERVAAIDPAWHDEAAARARDLRAQVGDWHAAWNAARDAGDAMTAGGPVLAPGVATRFPGIARLYFYDALRTAPDAARLDALAPLAGELDRAYGGGTLAAALASARTRDAATRGPLVAQYRAKLAAGARGEHPWDDAWLAATSKAGADDLVLGGLVAGGGDAAHRDLARRLVAAARDPWFEAWLVHAEARWAGGDENARADALTAALAACDRLGVPYRCLRLADTLPPLLLDAHRVAEAQAVARDELDRAARVREWPLREGALQSLAEIERMRSRFSLAAAYYEETIASADDCETTREARLALAEMDVEQLAFAPARREVAAAPTCDATWSLNGLQVLVDLSREDTQPDVAAIASIRARIAAARASADGDGARTYLDYLEGRLVIDAQPDDGRALLDRAIGTAAPDDDALADRARGAAFTTLLVDAARRGAWAELPAIWAREAGGAAPARCALYLVADDARTATLAIDDAGVAHGGYDPHGRTSTSTSTSTDIAALDHCAVVSVLARPPLYGAPAIFPAGRAWVYGAAGGASTGSLANRLIVADADPPAALRLPRLAGWRVDATGATELRGADATPDRVRAALPGADLIELDVHATVSRDLSDVAALVLTADPAGRWALTAADVAALSLPRHPLVVLADCGAGDFAPLLHAARGLPTAFLRAGARAVVATPSSIADADAPRFFGAIVDRVARGEAPAAAVAAERAAWLSRDPTSWVAQVVVFQ